MGRLALAFAYADPRFGHELARAIPGARLSLTSGAGHFLHEDQPDVVAAHLTAFFGEDATSVRPEP
jgi:pimeloyl-ACP methyl ester carboxylesterase